MVVLSVTGVVYIDYNTFSMFFKECDFIFISMEFYPNRSILTAFYLLLDSTTSLLSRSLRRSSLSLINRLSLSSVSLNFLKKFPFHGLILSESLFEKVLHNLRYSRLQKVHSSAKQFEIPLHSRN
jgi:hypothetical protein